MDRLSIPTTASLSAAQLLPATHPSVRKALNRLARPSLLSLCLDWLDERNLDLTGPYLQSPSDEEDCEQDENDLYPPASSLPELRDLYAEIQSHKGSKRDVVDRIIEGDWRNGLTLYQMAMIDMQYLYSHPTSQKWTALKIIPLSSSQTSQPSHKTPTIPRFHPATFLQNLQCEILPDIKAHYNLDRHTHLPLWILRVYIIDSPYNTSVALLHSASSRKITPDASRTFYIAFPDASPHIYISLTTNFSSIATVERPAADNRSLRKLVLDGIPKAFSRPRERYKLGATRLSARNLDALCDLRGGGRTNEAAGGWGIYAGEDVADNPLHIVPVPSPDSGIDVEEVAEVRKPAGFKRRLDPSEETVKRRKLVAKGRFGNSARVDDGLGIERLDVRMEDLHPPTNRDGNGREHDGEDGEWRPDIRITFHGSHVFAGIRTLVEQGIVDGERMPGWMTGEEGVSVGVVRDGRLGS